MSMRIRENTQLIRQIENRSGQEAARSISDKALLAGAKIFVKELKKQFETFKDTGASIDEITISEPMWVKGTRTVKVHWRGAKERYRIIHLNEWGTVNNPNPKGKGAVAKALRNSEAAYRNAIAEAIREGI